MRIAMVGSRGVPARAGGVERVVEELTAELSARGHDVIVYGRPWYLPPNAPPRRGRLIVTPGVRGKHLDTVTHTATACVDVLRRSVDVLHVHSPGPALMSWLPAMARIPVVFTVHAPDWLRRRWSLPARLVLSAGLRTGMRVAREVTAVSQPLAEELAGRFFRRVECVPNATRPQEPIEAREIRRWNLRPDQYVLHVGRLVPEKRLDVLLRGWRSVPGWLPLVVVGQFSERRFERTCRDLAQGRNVFFLGARYGRELVELYANAAVVVQPSPLEGMSLVLLEAADLGRCIIAADIPANRYAMDDNILYFQCGDESELSTCICRCLEKADLRRNMGLRAREHVRERWTWSASAEILERVYERACRTHKTLEPLAK